MKVVVNRCYGGFSLSKTGYEDLVARGFERVDHESHCEESGMYHVEVERNDPRLVAMVESIGREEASGLCAKLEIVDIPDGVDWQVDDYDGVEWVAEKHRTWQ